jgi:hypothetical protein
MNFSLTLLTMSSAEKRKYTDDNGEQLRSLKRRCGYQIGNFSLPFPLPVFNKLNGAIYKNACSFC